MSESGATKTSPKKRPSRLGRGLSSLMAAPVPVDSSVGSGGVVGGVGAEDLSLGSVAESEANGQARGNLTEGYSRIDVEAIRPNAAQPRQRFDESALRQLADSIKREGLIQPIVVRPTEKGGYELVAGERRWRAARLAGLTVLPAHVKELDDRQVAEWALIENLQREDLNPIERAEAFQRLGDVFGLSHEAVAQRVGLERSTVTNLLRLLKLSPPVREMVVRGTLSMGQSRAIASLEDPQQQLTLAEKAVRDGLSVRQVEAEVKSLNQPKSTAETPKKAVRAAYLDDLERQIGEQLNTKVQIKTARKKGAGTLSIDFYNIDQFDELLAKLGVQTQ